MYFVYSLLMGLAALLLLPYWLIQGLRHGKYLSNLSERLGFSFPSLSKLPADRAGAIWIHAVSVGEVLSGVALARSLKQAYPERPLIVSTTTMTGQALARQRLPFADAVIYFPLDWAFCVRRALRAVQPAVVVVLETEIWPNFLREAGRRKTPVIFVSGRISDRSFVRYQSYFGKFGFFLRPFLRSALGHASAFLMQSQNDADRIRALGAPSGIVSVSGNMKYDQALPAPTPLSNWLEAEVRRRGRHPVIVAGSVVAGEEEAVLGAYDTVQRQWRRTLFILAPRKPDRFDFVARLVAEGGWHVIRRSEIDLSKPLDENADVLILDSIGELAALYALADATFVGGSLVASGGHNILEPAQFGRPPVFGPHMENFKQMAEAFLDAKAGAQVTSGNALGTVWMQLIQNTEMREHVGAAAKALAESNRGATARTLEKIEAVLAPIALPAKDATQ